MPFAGEQQQQQQQQQQKVDGDGIICTSAGVCGRHRYARVYTDAMHLLLRLEVNLGDDVG